MPVSGHNKSRCPQPGRVLSVPLGQIPLGLIRLLMRPFAKQHRQPDFRPYHQ
jgi:hypothetical protein